MQFRQDRTIALVERQVLSPRFIVSNTFLVQEIGHALQLTSQGEVGKILLAMAK